MEGRLADDLLQAFADLGIYAELAHVLVPAHLTELCIKPGGGRQALGVAVHGGQAQGDFK